MYPEDSGEYSCRAFNDYGQAVTTASMKVQGNCAIVLGSTFEESEYVVEWRI